MTPTRCTPDAFARWLADPEAPATLVYWTGQLVEDAETDREARELAAAALRASGALLPSRRSGTGRNGQMTRPPSGPALVALTQRRLEPGRYEYLATRLTRLRRPGP